MIMMKNVGQLFVYARSDGIANSQLPVDVRGDYTPYNIICSKICL